MREIFISPTSLDEFQICKRKYFYSRRRKLQAFYKPERMDRGTVGHKILAYYYIEVGKNLVREVKKLREVIIDEAFKIGTLEAAKTDMTNQMTLTELFEVCNSYFRHYEGEDWTPLLDDKREPLVEVPLTKVLYERPDTEETEGIRVIFVGIIDLLLAPGRGVGVRIVDHKFPSRYTELEPLSNQLSLYSATTGIQDVVRNDVGGQKEGNVNKFRRPNIRYEKTQQDENIRWAIYWALEADYHEEYDIWPPTPTSCTTKYGKCVFFDVCGTIPGGREGVINANFKVGKRFSIYENEIVAFQPVASVQPGHGDVVASTEASVSVVRDASSEVDQGEQVPRDGDQLAAVQGTPEGLEPSSDRVGENAQPGPAEEQSTADKLLG